MPSTDPTVKVASTVSEGGAGPEIEDKIRIVRAASPGKDRKVVLSLGPNRPADPVFPDLAAGDRLRVFVELEVTTNPDPNAPGLIGTAYSYAPKLEATLLVAKDARATAPAPDRAQRLGDALLSSCSKDKHHLIITFGDYNVDVDKLDWTGPYFLNVTLAAAHPSAKPRDYLLVGQNQPTGDVGADMAGVRVVRQRPGAQQAIAAETTGSARVRAIPVSSRSDEERDWTVVYSHELKNLSKGEQLLVKGLLNTDASHLSYPARISTRLFLATGPAKLGPEGALKTVASAAGHLSKPNGVNRLPAEGSKPSQKFGVAEIKKAPGRSLYVNLSAVSSDPHGGSNPGDKLAVRGGGYIKVTRYPPERNG